MPGPVIAIIIAAAAVFLAAAVYLFMIFPGRGGDKRRPFENRYFAHRGLYSEDQSVPENSLPAFEAACLKGYGIELDVQLSRDSRVVVFHDDDLERACGIKSRVDAFDLDELEKMPLFGTGERIPLFTEVLETVGKRVPLIVELKTGPRKAELCEKTLSILREYGGEACVESFDPLIVSWFRKHAPEMLRGQLSQQAGAFRYLGINSVLSFVLANLMLNFLARPEFVAYRIGNKNLSLRLNERFGVMKVAWTANRNSDGKGSDAVIFEHCDPGPRGENA